MFKRTNVHLQLACLAALAAMLILAPTRSATAQSRCPDGNGWLADGICFAAWPQPGGALIYWRVERTPAPELVLERWKVGSSEPFFAVTRSSGSGEFRFFDTELTPGQLYQYRLVDETTREPIGEPLEVGLAVATASPSGDSYVVYLPLMLR